MFHVQANGLLGFFFGQISGILDFMGDAFGRQQARRLVRASATLSIAVPSIA
ncbi:hypothetical protein ACNKHS_24405 [Shigella flexneri]